MLQTASAIVSVNVYDVKPGILMPMKMDSYGNEEGQLQIMERTIKASEFGAGESGY